MFKVDIFHMSKFIVGDPGEPYCKIPIKSLKLLNKFLGTTIDNSKIEFRKIEDKFLFSVQHKIENCSSHFRFCLFIMHFYHFSMHDDQFITKLRTSVPIFMFVFFYRNIKQIIKPPVRKRINAIFSSS